MKSRSTLAGLRARVAALTGCAGCQHAGSTDHDRLNNAIAMDDVHTVRDAVQSATSHAQPAHLRAGYPDGAPLIAIAARAAALQG